MTISPRGWRKLRHVADSLVRPSQLTAVKRALGLQYRKLWICVNDLEALAALPSDTPRKFEFAWLHGEAGIRQIAQVAARERYPRRVMLMRRTLAEGGRIAVALDAGKPVSWQMYRPQEQTTCPWLHLRAHDAFFCFGSYTVRASRGHRLMTHLSRFAAATYAGQGFHRMCSLVEPMNKRSVRARIYRGDRTVGWITTLRLGRGLTLLASDARVACGFFNARNPFIYTVGEYGQVHSVKPWRLDDVLGKPLGRRG
jgi:hypothetical protein